MKFSQLLGPATLLGLSLLLIFMSFNYFIFQIEEEPQMIKTKCYDRYSNEIEGAVCYEDPNDYRMFAGAFSGSVGFALFFFFMISISELWRERWS